MATKDESLNGKHQLFVKRETDDDSRYKNLNLNQNQKSLNVFPVQSYNNSKTNNNKEIDFDDKESLQAWNSTNVNWKISHPLNLNIETKGIPKKCWTKENFSANNSTISLHISVYEGSNESTKTTENFVGLVNPFEFPRQQNENPTNMFEIMAFKSSQQLLRPTRTLTELALLNPLWPKPLDSIIQPWRQCGIGEKIRNEWKNGLTNYLFSITKIPNFLKGWYSPEFKTQLSADIGNKNLFDTNQKSRFEYKDQLIQPRTELNKKKLVKIDGFTSADVKKFCSIFHIKNFKQALFMLLRCPGTHPVFGSSILLQTLQNHFNNGDKIQEVLKQAESDFPYLEVIAGPFELKELQQKLHTIPDEPSIESPPPSPDKKVAEPEYMKYVKNLDRNVTTLTEIAIAVTSTNKATKIPSSEDQIKCPPLSIMESQPIGYQPQDASQSFSAPSFSANTTPLKPPTINPFETPSNNIFSTLEASSTPTSTIQRTATADSEEAERKRKEAAEAKSHRERLKEEAKRIPQQEFFKFEPHPMKAAELKSLMKTNNPTVNEYHTKITAPSTICDGLKSLNLSVETKPGGEIIAYGKKEKSPIVIQVFIQDIDLIRVIIYGSSPGLRNLVLHQIKTQIPAEMVSKIRSGGQSKSQKLVAAPKSQTKAPANGDETSGGDGGTKDTNDAKEKNDTSVVWNAKRADEAEKPNGFGKGESFDKGRDEFEWIVSREGFKVDEQFLSLNPVDGKVNGRTAKEHMLKSKLPNSVLGKIWKLADVDKDGFLDADEFALVNYLINLKLEGHELPNDLPQDLIPPGMKDLESSESICPQLQD